VAKTFGVALLPDAIDEANETFIVTLSNATNCGVSGSPCDDDDPRTTTARRW